MGVAFKDSFGFGFFSPQRQLYMGGKAYLQLEGFIIQLKQSCTSQKEGLIKGVLLYIGKYFYDDLIYNLWCLVCFSISNSIPW